MDDALTWLLDTVQSIDPVARTLIAGIAILLETSVLVGLLVPGDTVVLVASTGITSLTEFFALAIAVIIGALAGESVGFAIGRHFGPRIRSSRAGRWIGQAQWEKAETYVARRGGFAVFVSRFLPVLHSLVPVTVGMGGMTYSRFVAWTLPACTIWSFGYAGVGWMAAGSYRELSSQLSGASYLFVAIVVVFAAVVYLIKKRIARSEARYMESAGPGGGVQD